MKFWMN